MLLQKVFQHFLAPTFCIAQGEILSSRVDLRIRIPPPYQCFTFLGFMWSLTSRSVPQVSGATPHTIATIPSREGFSPMTRLPSYRLWASGVRVGLHVSKSIVLLAAITNQPPPHFWHHEREPSASTRPASVLIILAGRRLHRYFYRNTSLTKMLVNFIWKLLQLFKIISDLNSLLFTYGNQRVNVGLENSAIAPGLMVGLRNVFLYIVIDPS